MLKIGKSMNKQLKKIIVKLAFIIEVAFCGFFFSKNFMQIYSMKNVNLALQKEVKKLNFDVDNLQGKVDEWNADDFYKEQQAREHLQLARSNEEIYYEN